MGTGQTNPPPVESPADGHERGAYRGADPGPTLLVVGGIHGNEPAGLIAGERVLARLRAARPNMAGEVVFLAGNLEALARGVRYVDRDLNRIWRDGPAPAGGADDVEARELRATLAAVDRALARRRGEAYLLDLHTSSAAGAPFMTVGDTLRNRRFARQFPLPVILGLEEQIDGALLEFMNNRGLVTLGVEAGRHDDPAAIAHHESVIWVALVASGMLDARAVPDLAPRRAELARTASAVPPVVEVRHRHAIRAADGFRMVPGYSNFDPVRRGQVVAHARTGEVRFPEDGRMLLPLYQGLGDDGFFVAREVRPFWLRVSELARHLRLGALLRWLPGVRRHPARDGVLLVDTRVARWYPLEIFHLMGYRKLRRDGPILTVSRRAHDLRAPKRYV